MRLCFMILSVLLTISLCVGACASPLLTNGSATTYIGENNYMYLETPDGTLRRLQVPMRDLLGMDQDHLYCLTADNKIYAVRLDGSSSSMVSANAAPETIAHWRTQPDYELSNGILTCTINGKKMTLSESCLAACANHDTLFYIHQDGINSDIILRTEPLNAQVAATYSSHIDGLKTMKPISMSASKEAVCILGSDYSVQLISIATGEVQYILPTETTPDIANAVYASGQVLTYTNDENLYPVLSRSYKATINMTLPMVIVSTPQITATTAPTAHITLAPTPRPTSRPVPTQAPDFDETIYFGARGSHVRKMQQRLLKLGYPVGKVDGAFGKQTLFALNLFQDAIGYTNRKYCTAKCYSRLMAKSAPLFDLYRPLKKGDMGKSVELMQNMLMILGYGPDKADGIYGDKTVAAVAAFQKYASVQVDGTLATATTLFALYTLMNPLESPTPTPVPTLTPVPTTPSVIFITPSASPIVTPSQAPTPVPTAEPIYTVAPTNTPVNTPDTNPTQDPAVTPTEQPLPDPTQTSPVDPTTPPMPDPTQTAFADPTDEPEQTSPSEPAQTPASEPTEPTEPDPTQVPTATPTEIPSPTPTDTPPTPVSTPTPEESEQPESGS